MLVLNDLARLERRLPYIFKEKSYLKQALTHCSVGNHNNERLEFLGDSILNFVIACFLVNHFPLKTEGQLSRLRAFLVKGEMLAKIALELQLGDFLYLGQGELKSGGFRRASILADALEAVIAAIYLDGGMEAARDVIFSLYKTRLDDEQLEQNLKDPKTQLQEFLQAHKLSLPQYAVIKIIEQEPGPLFLIECTVVGLSHITRGEASSRRKAEQQAAQAMLQLLEQNS